MDLPFKYTTSFAETVVLSELDKKDLTSFASLTSLKDIMPEGIDLEKNIDLVGVAFNAAVANKFNKNGDGIDSSTAIAIKDYFIHKPANIEHNKQKVVGHIVGSSLSKFGTNELISPEEASTIDGPFNIALSAVVYRSVNPKFAELVQESVNENSSNYQMVSASWEIGFNDYAIAVGGDDLHECEIVEGEKKDDYKQFLKAYGGSGKTDKGQKVSRLIMGDIYPLGIGFTANPAAEVKGLTMIEKDNIEACENPVYEKIEVSNNIFTEKISHYTKRDVILSKNQKPGQNMEQEILKQLTETLESQASEKKLSQEAIANITKVFHDAIVDKSEQWKSDKEALESQKEDLVKASEESAKEIEDLKTQLASVSEDLGKIKTEVEAREEADRFNDRMSELDDMFELEDEDRVIIASELKGIKEVKAYDEYKSKLSVTWKHKTKAFKEEQEKLFNEKLEAEVQKRLGELSDKETVEASSEEVAEEAIENAEAEEEAVANNNADSAQEDLSLREQFKQAFSKDNVTIQL